VRSGNGVWIAPVGCNVDASDKNTDLSDQDLIAEINAGDEKAFETLYWRYRDWVVSLACRFTGDSDLALDVMQETFLYFVRKFPGFTLTAHFKTFLYPAVRNLSIAARRQKSRFLAEEVKQADLEEVLAPTSTHGEDETVRLILNRLPEDHREALLLRFVDGLSLGEVAAALEIPLGTVKSRLHNGLEKLRQDAGTRKLFDE
jgi:RNA polymerase sigma-70 factor (ECF subfamily)